MNVQPDKTTIDDETQPSNREAVLMLLLVVGGYLILAVAWMAAGEWVLVHVMQVPPEGVHGGGGSAGGGEHVVTIKDWVFIIASAFLLGCVLWLYMAWIHRGRRRLESRVELIAQNYQKIFDRNPLAMWVYEFGSSQILAANKAALQKYGYTEEEYKRMKVIELAAIEQFPRAIKVVTEYSPGVRETTRWTHRRKDGSTFPVEVVSDAIEYDGKSARLVIATDIAEKIKNEQFQAEQHQMLEQRVTDRAAELSTANENLKREIDVRIRMEAELVKAKEEAEAASETKSGFIANTSHEIRTPLTSILGYADLLADPDLSSESREKFVAVLQQNASHLLRLIDDLLDLSRMEMGRMAVTFGDYSPRELAQRAIDLIRPRAAEKSLSLALNFGEDVPAMVRTDGARVLQVLVNLLMNGVKFTAVGTVTLRVHADSAAERVWFDVTDTGIGMEHKDTQRIFEPFFQVDQGSNRRYGGAGLGLAISKELAALLGGVLEVTSEPGKGSTFRLGLPLATEEAPKTESVTPRTSPAVLSGHILLADDNAVVRWLVEEYLRRAGAIVTGVGDGQSAVAAVKESLAGGAKIDLVLMDINMPGMDGSEAMKKIRELGFTGPIAALTAHSVAVPTQEWMKVGWNAVASKPIDRNHFIPMVGRLIEEGRAKP